MKRKSKNSGRPREIKVHRYFYVSDSVTLSPFHFEGRTYQNKKERKSLKFYS